MLTLKKFNQLIEEILSYGELQENVVSAIDAIRNDFTEKETVLSEVGESYDETLDEYEFKPKRKGGEDWEGKYNELKQRYIDRFINGTLENEDHGGGKHEVDIPPGVVDDYQDSRDITIDELLYSGKKENESEE